MHEQFHACLQEHALGAELVKLDVEVHVPLGPLDERAAHGLQALHELPRDASDDPLAVEGELADGGDVAHGCHAAEEGVALYQGDLCSAACGGDCGDHACRPASAYHDVIFSCAFQAFFQGIVLFLSGQGRSGAQCQYGQTGRAFL